MPRANRDFGPGHVWHLTHRCHRRDFLLKFQRDRLCWCRWLFESRKRYDLCVLNYIGMSNHIHLLVRDTGRNEIQLPPRRYRIIDREALARALGLPTVQSLAGTHRAWIDDALHNDRAAQDDRWTQALALGSEQFARTIHAQLGIRAVDRSVRNNANAYHLAKDPAPYSHVPGPKLPFQGPNSPPHRPYLTDSPQLLEVRPLVYGVQLVCERTYI